MRRHSIVLLTAAVLFAVGCGSSSDSLTGTNTGNNNNATGPMSATIGGAAFVAVAPAVVFTNNIVSIAGIDVSTGTTISFAFQATGPGTFSLSFGNTIGGIAIVSKQSQGWVT